MVRLNRMDSCAMTQIYILTYTSNTMRFFSTTINDSLGPIFNVCMLGPLLLFRGKMRRNITHIFTMDLSIFVICSTNTNNGTFTIHSFVRILVVCTLLCSMISFQCSGACYQPPNTIEALFIAVGTKIKKIIKR